MLVAFASEIVLEKNELRKLKKQFYIIRHCFFFFPSYINVEVLPKQSMRHK